jgi:8-oxo-dGTP pyrophosphatase MutT (NUDIX family)
MNTAGYAKIEGQLILSGGIIINDRKEMLLLYRKDHKHYETPGGKVRLDECKNQDKPTIEDLARTAERELREEIGNVKTEGLRYFGKVEFIIPDGKKAIANKFLTRIISGKPQIAEPEKFSRLEYLPISRLEEYPISPDLKLLMPVLKEKLL